MAGVDILASAFSGANAAYLADLYAKWSADPASVDSSFAELFGALNDEARSVLTDAAGASWAPRHYEFGEPEPKPAPKKGDKAAPAPTGASAAQVRAAALDSLRALMLIRAYRVRGHLEAQLDPLGLQVPKSHPELDPASYGFTPADLDRPIFIDNVLGYEHGDNPPDHRDRPRQLLRPHRRRVHAHPGPRPEGLDPAPDRGRALGRQLPMPAPSAPSCSS